MSAVQTYEALFLDRRMVLEQCRRFSIRTSYFSMPQQVDLVALKNKMHSINYTVLVLSVVAVLMEDPLDSGLSPLVSGSGRRSETLDDEPSPPLASCHAGIDGLPAIGNGGGVRALGTEGPRLRSSVLRDFNSCCSSVKFCVCASLFFSSI